MFLETYRLVILSAHNYDLGEIFKSITLLVIDNMSLHARQKKTLDFDFWRKYVSCLIFAKAVRFQRNPRETGA